MNEWTTYGINIPARSISVPADGLPLQTVYHVVHLSAARRTLKMDVCVAALSMMRANSRNPESA